VNFFTPVAAIAAALHPVPKNEQRILPGNQRKRFSSPPETALTFDSPAEVEFSETLRPKNL